jgi:hypothetical protein
LTVNVSDVSSGRSSTATAHITIEPSPSLPQVWIVVDSIITVGATSKVDGSNAVQLYADTGVDGTDLSALALEWSLLFDPNHEQADFYASSFTTEYFAIAGGALTSSATYEFRLSATDADGNVGLSTVSVLVNAPPAAGHVTVAPESGNSLCTVFAVTMDEWEDESADDLPLRYTFGYYASSSHIPIGSQSDANSIETTLSSSAVSVQGVVFDQFGGSSSDDVTVSVTKGACGINETTTGELLSTAVAEADATEIIAIVSLVAEAANSGGDSTVAVATTNGTELLIFVANASAQLEVTSSTIEQQALAVPTN